MATVTLSALFPATAHVKLYKRVSAEPHLFGGDVVAHAAVGADSRLVIEGLEPGGYWAVVDGQPPVAVTAKGGRVERVTEDRRTRTRPAVSGDVITAGEDGQAGDDGVVESDPPAADVLVDGDPKAAEAPVATRDIVTGPRTSANTRVKAEKEKTAKPSLTERLKGGK